MSEKKLLGDLIKLAHSVPEMRPHLLPLIARAKKAAPAKTWKMIGTLDQREDGSVTLSVAVRGGSAAMAARSFKRAMMQRKLDFNSDGSIFNFTSPGRPGGMPEEEEPLL